jgi:magnesium chelatase family protein
MCSADVQKYCLASPAVSSLLKKAVSKFALSARGYHRLLKVSRTLADLDGSETLTEAHVLEALQYRKMEA